MKRTRQERNRLVVLFVAVILFFAVVTVRLIQLQVVNATEYSRIVDRQSSGKVPIPADRGAIYDREGKMVAGSVNRASLYAYPNNTATLSKVAHYVEQLLGLEPGTAVKRYGLSVKRFRWIRRRLADNLARRIENEAPVGLYLRNEKCRTYPYGQVGKQILGFTDIDNRGQAGLELSRDSLLAGHQGFADIRRDGLRNTFRVNETALVKPVPGTSYILSVEWALQEMVEEELRAAVEEHNARSGMAVFVDCNNGDILAAAHFDPNEENRDKPVKLRAVTDQFEPGSVFKAFTVAALLDADQVNFNDTTYCEEGAWRMGRRTLHDDKKRGWLSFREIVEFSSNIGIAKYAIDLGGEQLLEAVKRFGLGEKLNVGLPGETSGRLARPTRWSDYNISAMAMGHAVTVSALQMATAFAAIANGGELLRPHLVIGEIDEDGNVVARAEKEVMGRAFNPNVADSLRSFLRGVVENGTAEIINSKTVALAGKTGTAQIPDPANNRYFRNRYMGSFAGFFPYDRPLVAGIVVIEDPQPIHYGGYTAGPVFKKVAERYAILHAELLSDSEHLMVETDDDEQDLMEVPNFIGRTAAGAVQLATHRNLNLRCDRSDGYVVWQFPAPDRLAFPSDEILTAVQNVPGEKPAMISLIGLTIREVSAYLEFCEINFEIRGNGRVVSQSLPPGKTVADEAVCKLRCEPI